MIKINFSITNPFKHKAYQELWQRNWHVTQNRTLEVQVYRYAYYLFEFWLDLRWSGCDHAGPRFYFSIFGWNLDISLPSNSHWNNETQDWQQHD